MILRATVCSGFLLLLPTSVRAQHLVLPKGALLAEMGATYFSTDEKFDNDGQRKEIPDLTELTLFFSIEYGINHKLTLAFTSPFWVKNELNVNDAAGESFTFTNQAGGDTEFSIRYQVLPDSIWPLALSYHQGLSMADADDRYGLNTGFDDFYQYFALSTGKMTKSERWLFYAQAGYHNHTNGFPDEIRAIVALHYKMGGKHFAGLKVEGISPLSENDLRDENPWGLYSRESGKLTAEPHLLFSLAEKVQVSMGAEFFLRGQHIHDGPQFRLSLRYFHLRKSN